MSKPINIKDLEIAGVFSKTDGRTFAAEVLGDAPLIHTDIESLQGYEVRLPRFNDLEKGLQGYLVKVLIESTVVNVLDADEDDEEAEMAQDVADYDAAKAAEED
jgi:hypothetical protein